MPLHLKHPSQYFLTNEFVVGENLTASLANQMFENLIRVCLKSSYKSINGCNFYFEASLAVKSIEGSKLHVRDARRMVRNHP